MLCGFTVTGCQLGGKPGTSAVPVSTAVHLSGAVHGGQQPITGATMQLMAVGSAGDGSASTSLMNPGVTATTDAGGNFNISGMYTCPSTPTYVYLLSTGGNPGLAAGTNNPQSTLLAGLGLCSSLSSSTFISLNEITTVGTVAALLPFMTSATAIGSGTSDAPQLATAMGLINQYVNIATGSAPGALPNGSLTPTTNLITLADVLSICVNSSGGTSGDGTNCGTLFATAAPAHGTAPTDTVTALIDILAFPRHNSSSFLALVPTTPPFLPTLSSSPNDWSLPIYTASSGLVELTTPSYSVNEGTASASFTVTNTSTGGASVGYATTSAGEAYPGLDYVATNGTLTWAAGDTSSRTITVPLYNPGHVGGTRYFQVYLNTPVGVRLDNGSYELATLTINETDTALAVPSSQSLTIGSPNTAYSATLTATGGVLPYTWSISSGTLPTGLTLNPTTGVISGTPTTQQINNVVFQVTDSATPANQTAVGTVPVVITSSLGQQVYALPTTTTAQTIKRALLIWGIGMVQQLTNNGETTAAANLTTDINNDLNATFTIPSTLPANLFPAIPSIATNPFVTQQISTTNSQLSTDAASPPTYPTTYTAASSAANDIEIAQQMTWGLLYSGQSLYMNPSLIASIMTRMENGTAAMANFTVDFTTTSSVPLEYMLLTQGWSQLVFPSRQAVWLAAITNNQNRAIALEGAHLATGPNDTANNWINADVKWLEGIAYGAMILNAPQTAIVQGGLAEMAASVLPDGGTNYIEVQNESCTYHGIFVTELARYAQVTGDTTGNTLAAQTKNYFPLTFEPGNVCEFNTAPANKKYWNGVTGGAAQQIVTYLTGDAYNQYQLQNTNYGRGFDAAPYYRTDITPQALPSQWITYDRNSQGPRSINNANNFSFQSSTRNTDITPVGLGNEGLPTFVGGLLVDSTAANASWALNGAVERIGNTVNYAANAELNLTGSTFADLATSPHSAQITTSTFGSVSTIHSLVGYKGTTTSWKQTETWVLLPTRVIGLCSMVNTAAETAYQLEGAVHFVSGVATGGTQKTLTALTANEYAYSVAGNSLSMLWQLYGTDYANITTEYSQTYSDPGYNKASNLLLNDAHNSATTQYTWPAGTSHYFFSEFRPSTSTAAGSPTLLTGLPTGLVGFTFVDQPSGLTYIIVHNPTAAAVAYTPSSSFGSTITMSGTQYRAPWIDPSGTQSVPSATYTGSIPAYSHIVITK
jgi:hypothetical protein